MFFFFVFSLFLNFQNANADQATEQLLVKINKQWRSSDRYIDHDTLRNEALNHIQSSLLDQLELTPLPLLRRTLEEAAKNKNSRLQVNQGMAENIIKIREIAKRMGRKRNSAPRDDEMVFGLTQSRLDSLVRNLPAVSDANRRANEFDYSREQGRKEFEVPFSTNDFYALKIAAMWWAEGMHERANTTAEVFARGKKEIPMIVTLGQDVVIDNLERARFSEADIQFLKHLETMKDIPEGFWDYLRTWRFSGQVEMVPPGTIVAPNTAVMEIRANPIDIALIEAPLLMIMDEFSKSGTAAVRVVHEAGGKPVVEGGTRRGWGASIRSLTAVIGGFVGTSNVRAARLFGLIPSGSAETHGAVGHFEDEMDAHTTVLKYYRAEDSFLLADTYNLERGVKIAIRAGGHRIKGFRIDSLVPGKSIPETLDLVNQWIEEAGFARQIQVYPNPALFSDDLDEYKVKEIKGSPFGFTLVGGRLKNAPSLGYVMKVTNVLYKDGTERNVLKMANAEKALWPGDKELYRIEDEAGRFQGDVLTRQSEIPPSSFWKKLRILAWSEKGRIYQHESTSVLANRVLDQRMKMPPNVMASDAPPGVYPLGYSPELKKLKERMIAQMGISADPQIGVFPISEEMLTVDTIQLIQEMKSRYMLDRVYLLPSKELDLKDVRHLTQIVDGLVVFSVPVLPREALDLIAKYEGGNANVYLMANQKSLLDIPKIDSAWARRFNLILGNVDRRAVDIPQIQSVIRKYQVSKDGNNLKNADGKVIEVGLYALGRSQVAYDGLPYSFVLHVTDAQWTFLKRSKIPGRVQKEDGALSVDGTQYTVPKIVDVVRAALSSGKGRVSYSKDAHLQPELEDPSQNGEFHGKNAFGLHGMKNLEGPAGDSLIEELNPFIRPDNSVLVPDNRVEEGRLVQESFDFKNIESRITDPAFIVGFEKNGPRAFDVDRNPKYREYLNLIDPQKRLPHFHLGWCTDVCDRSIVLKERALGYEVYFIVDAAAGVFPLATKQTLLEMLEVGVKFITTQEFVELADRWQKRQSSWAAVKEDLKMWEEKSTTRASVLKQLEDDYWNNKLPIADKCSVILDVPSAS